MASKIPEQLIPILSLERTIIWPISSLSVMYLIYGFYILLYGTYLYMMRTREQRHDGTTANRVYLRLTTALFALSTLFVASYTTLHVINTILFFDALKTEDYEALSKHLTPGMDIMKEAFSGVYILTSVFLNITADWMLIHRCYTIWSFDKRIGVPLILASVIVNSVGVISVIMMIVGSTGVTGTGNLYHQGDDVSSGYAIGSIVINSILSLLTAGRIWWIHRQIRAHGVYTSDKLVPSVCRIILESGVLYPFFQIANMIMINTTNVITFPIDFLVIATLMAGVAPTLIMVRAKLGKTVENLQTGDPLSDIRFSTTPVTTTAQAQSLHVALTEVVVDPKEGGSPVCRQYV